MHRSSWMFDYWLTLGRMRHGADVIDQTLDIPLENAGPRSVWAVAWSALCWMICALCNPNWPPMAWLSRGPGARLAEAMALYVVAVPVLYGLFRLFTLVNHTMTIHLFRVRGQRLRLLNALTSVMSLTAPAAVGAVLANWQSWTGWLLTGVCAAWAARLLTRSYNRIFHRHGARGLLLWTGSTLLTTFVLGIGLISILAFGGVLIVIILAILRAVRPG